jgi:hypothetical protein
MMDISDSEEIHLHCGHLYSHTTNILSVPRSSMRPRATNRESTSKDSNIMSWPSQKSNKSSKCIELVDALDALESSNYNEVKRLH